MNKEFVKNRQVKIRPYRKLNREMVQNVCLETASIEGAFEEPIRSMMLTAFCNYYIEEEPEQCFVAVDGEQVVGYILCTKDSNEWAERFLRKYVSNLKEGSLKSFYQGTMESPIKYAERYPAHLHIDILPKYQRQGIGFQLMDALTAHLREQGVPAVMLSVAGDNEKGKNFYRKYGFQVLEETPHEIVMGLSVSHL